MKQLSKNTLFTDLGNYELKLWDGTQIRAIRSIRFQLPQGRRPLEGKPNSPLIEYQGQEWHLGIKAYEYRKQTHIVEGDKSKNILLSALACCDFPAKEFQLSVHTSHPTPDLVADDIKEQLQGCHVFSRNNRKHIVHIEEVTVESEGLGAWRHAKRQGLIPSQGYVAVIDIGGGTWISRLFNLLVKLLTNQLTSRVGLMTSRLRSVLTIA